MTRPHSGGQTTRVELPVLRGLLLGLAIEDGAQVFDLLKGDYAYKYRFGATPRAVRRLIAERNA